MYLTHKVLAGLKFHLKDIPWKEIRNILKVHNRFIKYDDMPPGSKLIYSLPFAHYFINSYITIVPFGSIYLLSSVAYYNSRFLSLTKEDFKTHPFLKDPTEYYVFLSVILGIVIISLKFTHDWPIRIYRLQNNQYNALFVNKLLPFKIKKYNFEEVSKAKTWKLSIFHENKHLLDNKKIVGLFDHYIEPPIEYFQMMTPKDLRKTNKM